MARDRSFHQARIIRVVDETPDSRTYVLDAPFGYQAGQFATFRIRGALRSYSMSSSPATDAELMTTVKRVPGGLVSNWMIDNLAPGDVLEMTPPAGVFCLRDTDAPLVALAGGSGITPVMSLAKSALATTGRPVRLLTANRDAKSVIFADALARLAESYPGRLDVRHHLDDKTGFLTAAEVAAFVGHHVDADFYLCGPAPFMDMAERALLTRGVHPSQIFTERFTVPDSPGPSPDDGATDAGGTITVILDGERREVPRLPGKTLLESARQAGLEPPSSCEAGNCATCIARILAGEARMRVNNALDEREIEEGWVLTCQGEAVTPEVTVTYDDP